MLGGYLADRLSHRDLRWYLWVPAWSTLLALPLAIPFLLVPNRAIAIAFFFPYTFFGSFFLGPVLGDELPAGQGAHASGGVGDPPLHPQPDRPRWSDRRWSGILNDALAPRLGAEAVLYSLLIVNAMSLLAVVLYLIAGQTLRRDLPLNGQCVGGSEPMNRAAVRTAALSCALAASFLAPPVSSQVPAGSIFFDQISDTIEIAGHTVLGTTATFEARVFFPTGVGDDGGVFTEWTQFAEDKVLYAGPDYVAGYTHPIVGMLLQFAPTLTLDAWHHLAFVHDSGGNEQRLYIDGVKVATHTGSGDIGDGGGDSFGHPFLGAIFRDGSLHKGFIGYLDTLRISDNARYSGDSFTPPPGDLSDDANTVVLFNFAAADITFGQSVATVADLSGNVHAGTFGTGFPDATSPRVPGHHRRRRATARSPR